MGKHVLVYPPVFSEEDTIAAVAKGYSLARFGDGELKLILGGSALREPANQALGLELRDVLRRKNDACIVGIPTLNITGPKYENWRKHADRFCSVLSPDVQYYSAFISRPDSAPWIDTEAFARSIEQLWAGKRVAVVCEPEGFMLRTVTRTAGQVVHVPCPKREAYAQIDWLMKQVLRYDPEFVVLAAGPTATCMAARLARAGVHALDLGSAGRFIYRKLWPKEYAALNPPAADESA